MLPVEARRRASEVLKIKEQYRWKEASGMQRRAKKIQSLLLQQQVRISLQKYCLGTFQRAKRVGCLM